jgi:ubiquinone/menaquinone biosynthesis C-methylase UbiE
MTPTPSARAVSQYATTTGNLTARIALHAYGTNPLDWFSWLDERLPLAGDVLEVGAGTGKLWTHVDHIGRGLSLTLTDFSPAMCEHLHTIPGARVQQCDATDLPFPDDSLDTVIANHMLYHLDDPAAALRDFARVLRPGGRLAIATNGSDHLDELNTIGPAIGRPELRLGAHNNEPFSSWVAVVFGVLEDGDRLDDRGGAVWAAVQLSFWSTAVLPGVSSYVEHRHAVADQDSNGPTHNEMAHGAVVSALPRRCRADCPRCRETRPPVRPGLCSGSCPRCP